jgi:disulfide bond formation protein DsbB
MLLTWTTGWRGPALITFASIAILGTALASQYWGELHSCILCLYQRWPYSIAVGAGAIATALVAMRQNKAAALIVAGCSVAFAAGGGIAAFHVGVEQHWWQGTSSCSGDANTLKEMREVLLIAPVIRCDDIAWSLFGVSMAGYNIVASLALSAYAALTVRSLWRPTA